MGNTTSKNLGMVAAAIRSVSPPENIDLIWLDISGVTMIRKVWDPLALAWVPLVQGVGGGGSDNWGTQVVAVDNSLSGQGIIGNLLGIAQQGATDSQVLKWNAGSNEWLPADEGIGAGLTEVEVDTNIFEGDGTVGNPVRLQTTNNGYIPKYNSVLGKWVFAPDNIGGVFVKGMVIMWSGNVGQIPSGWRLCNPSISGTVVNGVGIPNLGGKFIAGYDPADADYNAIGKKGGAKTVTLTTAQMPVHSHGVNDPGHAHSILGGYHDIGDDNNHNLLDSNYGRTNTSVAKTGITIQNSGGGAAHENRPSFYTLAYLIYVGA